MSTYTILWKKSAVKELGGIPKDLSKRIYQTVSELGSNPFPFGQRKLVGSEHSYRIRIGDYRIIYTVDSDRLVIEVIRLGHRKDVYR